MNKEWKVKVPHELEVELATSFAMGPIWNEKGQRLLVEHTVGEFDGLKIEIFSDEHPPPHFRVTQGDESANFRIKDCAKINGGLTKWERTIRAWHGTNKPKLIETWNATRPSGCPVGPYRE